jgi:hypothetical protein
VGYGILEPTAAARLYMKKKTYCCHYPWQLFRDGSGISYLMYMCCSHWACSAYCDQKQQMPLAKDASEEKKKERKKDETKKGVNFSIPPSIL